MLLELDSIPWASLAQPAGNDASTVPNVIRALAAAASTEDAQRAYNDFLYAVGSNHAGTYFPVVLHALPFLAEILRSGQPLAREAILDVLIDLVGSFEPDAAHEVITTESGAPAFLSQLVFQCISDFVDVVQSMASHTSEHDRAHRLANELLELLSEA